MMSGPKTFTIPARWIAIAALALVILPSAGCRICTSTEDLAYPSYGGAWQRTIRDSGRVGSLFDPAGALASELVSREDPITADEVERNRRDAEGNDEDDPSTQESDEPSDGESMDDVPSDDPRDRLDAEPDSPRTDRDAEIERLKQELRDKKMDEVKVIHGDPLPPLLR